MNIYKQFWLAGVAAATVAACSSTNMGVTTKVKAKLAADPVVKAYQIDVDTQNGIVTLKGNIDDPAAKERALTLARETEGVRKVNDMISVRTSATSGDAPDANRTIGGMVDDGAISMRVKERLSDDPMVKARDIDVDTRGGVVYLTGTVQSEQERDAAIKIARETDGVREVQANLTIG